MNTPFIRTVAFGRRGIRSRGGTTNPHMHVILMLLLLLLPSAAEAAGAGDLRLIEAARRVDAAAVQTLLGQGVDVNATQGDGATALHWAAHRDDALTTELLIEAGADVNATNDFGIPPLMLACTNGSDAMVARLLDAGADPNLRPEGRETALMTSAWTGNLTIVELLIARGALVNATEAERSQTALMWAVAERHPQIARFLLDHGADVHARTLAPRRPARTMYLFGGGPPSLSYTPLLFAARVGDTESMRVLLDAGADVDDVAGDGLSALALATVRGHTAAAMLLLTRGANPNLADAGYTALHWAAGRWETDLTTDNITSERPGEWHTIAGLQEGKLDLVKALLANGADPDVQMDGTPTRAGASRSPLPELVGATPYLLAAAAGDAAVMQLLADTGADVHVRTTSNATPLMAAAGFGRVLGESTVQDTDSLAAATLAVALGADTSATDDVGNTALHYAAYLRQDAAVRFLADEGAPLNAKNKFGETPLWVSELAIQFSGGGTFQILQSSTGDLLRTLGASILGPAYDRARPRDWPDNDIQ